MLWIEWLVLYDRFISFLWNIIMLHNFFNFIQNTLINEKSLTHLIVFKVNWITKIVCDLFHNAGGQVIMGYRNSSLCKNIKVARYKGQRFLSLLSATRNFSSAMVGYRLGFSKLNRGVNVISNSNLFPCLFNNKTSCHTVQTYRLITTTISRTSAQPGLLA